MGRTSNASDVDRAKDDALKYLSYRARSIFEVEERLKKKGFTDETIEGAVGRLKELNILDDEDFARRMTKDLISLKGYGRFYVIGRLRQKGIEPEIIENALKIVFSEINEKEVAKNLVLKKKKGKTASNRDMEKIGRYLQSKGYTWDIIREVLEELDIRERD